MNIHILFYPSRATSPSGDPLPTEPLSLRLEEEVQQRCAGFIQSSIEQYAELLEDGSRVRDEEPESEYDNSEDEEPAPTAKGGKGKGKNIFKPRAKSSVEPGAFPSAFTSLIPIHFVAQAPTRALLEQEYHFMATVSTFLRAIRVGAVHVKHSDVLLANYGRLGPSFDLCTKVIIDVLREEGMYNDNGELVVTVIKKALLEVRLSTAHRSLSSERRLQSFSLVVDAVVKDEEHMVGLAKQLSTSFLIRGAQLAVVRRLESRYVVKTHKDLLQEAVKNVSAYEKSKNKKRLSASVSFFRALVPLLKGVESRDALAM